MLRTLLIGLDGSPPSQATIQLGIHWAQRFDALLVGVAVVNEPAIRGATTHPREGGYLSHLQEQWIHQARHRLDQQLEQFALDCAAAQVACKPLEDVGAPWEEILRESQRYDIIMLSQHAEFEGDETERTLQEVLSACPRPLVVVPPQVALPPAGEILVAYDGSVQAARALQAFVSTGLHQLGPLRVLSVDAQDRVAAARIADRAKEYLAQHGIEATTDAVVAGGSVCELLCESIEQHQSQLLVMGACSKSRFTEFIVGSVTKSMIKSCSVPTFVFH